MNTLDPGWWIVIVTSLIGVFGTIIVVLIKRPDVILPVSRSRGQKGEQGGPGIDTHPPYSVPGLAEACQKESSKIEYLQTSYATMASKIERLDEKMVDARQYMVGVHEKLVDTARSLVELKTNIDIGFEDMKREIRNTRGPNEISNEGGGK